MFRLKDAKPLSGEIKLQNRSYYYVNAIIPWFMSVYTVKISVLHFSYGKMGRIH